MPNAKSGAVRHILHPSDFSPASSAAFTKALALARDAKAQLTIVHVLSPAVVLPVDVYVAPRVYDDIQRSAETYARKKLDVLLARARKAGVRAKTALVEGVAAERIVAAARRNRADLIVIGTHGRTGLARLMLGSVASRVVATAACPVLTVRGRGQR
jgi:nucleotide-binding universal stress UspA family protein